MKYTIVSGERPKKTSAVFQSLMDPTRIIKAAKNYVVYDVSPSTEATWTYLSIISERPVIFEITFN